MSISSLAAVQARTAVQQPTAQPRRPSQTDAATTVAQAEQTEASAAAATRGLVNILV